MSGKSSSSPSSSSSSSAATRAGGKGAQSDVALAMLQAIELQSSLHSMLIDGYEWSFKACTREGSGPQLSAKESRCIQTAIATTIDGRSYMAQALNARGAGGASAGHAHTA